MKNIYTIILVIIVLGIGYLVYENYFSYVTAGDPSQKADPRSEYNEFPHPIVVDTQKASDLLIVYFEMNLGTLSQIKPVLGGTWQVTNIELDANTKTGAVYYEDGHIAAKGTFSYQFMGYSEDRPYPVVTNFAATSL